MKSSKLALAALAATWALSLTVQAKNESKKAYIFGFASSFNDSTVYFTDIQEVDSAWFTGKAHFLVSRENYSYQLRDYLSGQGEDNRTCAVMYSTDAKKTEKLWNKLHTRYEHKQKSKNNQKQVNQLPPFQIKHLTKEQFAFQAVEPTDEGIQPEKPTKEALKEEKKAKKLEMKAKKEEMKAQKKSRKDAAEQQS